MQLLIAILHFAININCNSASAILVRLQLLMVGLFGRVLVWSICVCVRTANPAKVIAFLRWCLKNRN
jgi:hypothetical protein